MPNVLWLNVYNWDVAVTLATERANARWVLLDAGFTLHLTYPG